MRTLHVLIIMFALFIGLTTSVRSEISDGNSILKDCNAVISSIDSGKDNIYSGLHCLGLMQGIISLNMHYQIKNKDELLFCSPDSITPLQTARIVSKFLNDHPEKLHEFGPYLAIEALIKVYPCK